MGLLAAGRAVTLSTPSAAVTFDNALASAGGNMLASWRASQRLGGARPVEVMLNVASPQLQRSQIPIYAGMGLVSLPDDAAGFAIEPQYAGFFVLEYGAGPLIRRRIIDLNSARLYLGVCDQVTISAARWRGTDWPVYYTTSADALASAAILESNGAVCDEMTATQQKYIAALSTPNISFVPPDGANSCSMSVAKFGAPSTYWGSAEPDFIFQVLGNCGNETFTWRPSQYTVVPPFRRSALAAAMNGTTSAPTVAATVATVQWYLSA